MTSIDDLFKKPSLPSGAFKRKFETPDAQEAYKATKLSHSGSPHVNGRGATVEDGNGNDDDNDDDGEDDLETEAGPSLPPPDEEEDDEDEEGRFFGGGVTRNAAQALDFLDEQDPSADGRVAEEKIDGAWLKRLCTTFEKKVSRNSALRAKYAGDPQKFMASEADLDAEVKSWSLLAEHPELYDDFASSGGPALLVGLLGHENTDIAIGAIEIIAELVDQDVEAENEQWEAVASALLEADLVELLMSNLERLDEKIEGDQSGVYHSLAVMENLASQPSIAERIGQARMLEWLCQRTRKPESPCSQNKQYAAEVLQILLQSSSLLRRRLATDIDGVDLFLQLLAAYRKRDPPKDSHEEEYAENIFGALISVVVEAEGKAKFLDAEGVELCLIMLKEGSFSKPRAIRLLDHALGGDGVAAANLCAKLVEMAGLRTVFGMFMKKTNSTSMEHVLGIIASLLRLLPGESAARIRTLAKFEEKDYEKLDRLCVVRKQYADKVAAVEEEISLEQRMLDAEEREERADEWLSRRLDGGAFVLQTIDIILAWLVAEDAAAKKRASTHLGSLQPVKESLMEQLDGLDPGAAEQEDTREMLHTLIGFLT